MSPHGKQSAARGPTLPGMVVRHLVADAGLSRARFDAGVRWFGPAIQAGGAQLALFVGVPLLSLYMSGGVPTFYVAVLYFALMTHYAAHLSGSGRLPGLQRLRGIVVGPIGVALFLLSAYAVASVGWSVHRSASAEEAAKLVGALSLMFALFWLMPRRDRAWQDYLPLLGLGAAATVLVLEFGPLPLLRERLYGENAAYMNRAVVILGFLLWPTLAAVSGRQAGLQRMLLLTLVAAAIFTSRSQAAMLGFLVGGGAALAALVAPRALAMTIAAATTAIFATAPLVAPHLGRLIHLAGLSPYLDASNTRRLEIWTAFSDVVWHRPVFGWGLQASSEFGILPISNVRWMTGATYHPHNMLIQTWAELGAVGVVLMLGLLLLVIRAVARAAPPHRPYWFGCLATGLTIGTVSHGMWQTWWICLILGAVLILSMVEGTGGTGPRRGTAEAAGIDGG